MTSYCGTCGGEITNEFDERPGREQRDEHDCPGRRLCATSCCPNEAREATGYLGRHCDECRYNLLCEDDEDDEDDDGW